MIYLFILGQAVQHFHLFKKKIGLKLKAFAEDKLDLPKLKSSVCDGVENILGK